MSKVPATITTTLKQVRLAALTSLSSRRLAYPIACPLGISNRGLSRRFELISDTAMIEEITSGDPEVAYLVFYNLHELLFGSDDRPRKLLEELCGNFCTAASATSAALLAVDHYAPRIKPSIATQSQGDQVSFLSESV